MGIIGLQSYLERNFKNNGGFDEVDLKQLVSTYKENTGKTPVIIFDTASCLRHIYAKCKTDSLCGGQLKEFIHVFDNFYKKIIDLGVECVFFSDGFPPPDRLTLWKDRRIRESIQCGEVLEYMSKRHYHEARKLATDMRPIALFQVLLSHMQAYNIKIIQTVIEADDEIMDFISTNGCMAVIGQDSDFVICEGIDNYLSIEHFDFENLKTYAYRSTGLQRLYSLQKNHLPLIATLCGNDIVSSEMLRAFHLNLLRFTRNKRNFNTVKFLPRFLLIPEIACWIHKHITNEMSVDDMAHKLAVATNNSHLIHLFVKSIKSYLLPPIRNSDDVAVTKKTSNWDLVVEKVNEMFRNEFLHHNILSIVAQCSLFAGVPIQFYARPDHPPSTVSLRKLRQKLYGILLKERPKTHGKPVLVEEYVLCQQDQKWPALVEPIYPDDHPGLLKLWDDKIVDDENKWRLLCWAVSDQVNRTHLMRLAAPLQVPALALFYMIHEAKLKMNKWQIEALLAHVVQLMSMSVQTLREMMTDAHDALSVHFGNVYQSTCIQIYTVSAACGYPSSLHHHPRFSFFDGKLFHSVYLKMDGGKLGIDCCGSLPEQVNNYQEIQTFLFPNELERT